MTLIKAFLTQSAQSIQSQNAAILQVEKLRFRILGSLSQLGVAELGDQPDSDLELYVGLLLTSNPASAPRGPVPLMMGESVSVSSSVALINFPCQV